jgi:hypothetical protein
VAKSHKPFSREMVTEWNRHDENRKEYVFQITEPPRPFVLFDFWRRDFIQNVLHQPEGTKPAADEPTKGQRQQQ